jgi:hypothetical protein
MRKHLPPVVFVFLLLIAVMVIGVACACLTDHPMQAVEKAFSAIAAAPALIVVWSAFGAALVTAAVSLRRPRTGQSRASPQVLQRFRF